MPYRVQFVGLVCFVAEEGGRKVFMPDGRNASAEGIESHYGSIIVDPRAVIGAENWPAGAAGKGTFSLDPCTIALEGADVPGVLDATAHDGLLPQLKRIAPAFVLDPAAAQTIARLDIRQGTLAAYKVPAGDALISQLDVPHDGPIHVTVTPQDGSAARTITLSPGTEIAVTNMAAGGYDEVHDENGHFRIYEKLSARPVRLSEPTEVADVPPSPTGHVMFTRANPIGLSTSCSNTGCCAP